MNTKVIVETGWLSIETVCALTEMEISFLNAACLSKKEIILKCGNVLVVSSIKETKENLHNEHIIKKLIVDGYASVSVKINTYEAPSELIDSEFKRFNLTIHEFIKLHKVFGEQLKCFHSKTYRHCILCNCLYYTVELSNNYDIPTENCFKVIINSRIVEKIKS